MMSSAESGEDPRRSIKLSGEQHDGDRVQVATNNPAADDQPFLLTGWELNALMAGLGLSMLLVGLVGGQSARSES
jgi:hypothetical protein